MFALSLLVMRDNLIKLVLNQHFSAVFTQNNIILSQFDFLGTRCWHDRMVKQFTLQPRGLKFDTIEWYVGQVSLTMDQLKPFE